MRRMTKTICGLVIGVGLTACASGVPEGALRVSEGDLSRRQAETRRFDGASEAQLLQASVGVLQDLGFTVEATEPELGVVVASEESSAVRPGQVALMLILSVIAGTPLPYDKEQTVRAAVVTRPLQNRDSVAVRLTLQRIVRDNYQREIRLELLHGPELHQAFFEKLSKSLFLEGHRL